MASAEMEGAVLVSDHGRLVAALRERGVDYLMPSDAQGEPVSDETLIASLAANGDPRLRAALTALFILRPTLASTVPDVLPRLEPPADIELMARYMAAVYLQNLWRTRLGLYLADFPSLPDLYSLRLGLPAAREGFGKPGLLALAEWHQQQSPIPYNRFAEYALVMQHVFASLKLKARRHEPATVG